MDEKTTVEITNDKLEEALKDYVADRTKEKLTDVLNMMRTTQLLIPAMMKAPDQPTPCFLKNSNGEQFLAVYTSKEQIPEEPKSQAIIRMPFPACNNLVVKPELNLAGMAVNPFTDNLILKTALIEKLHEADQKIAQTRQVKVTPEQFHLLIRKQVEFAILPKRLFAEGESFVQALCEEKESLVNEIFKKACTNDSLYPYSEDDYSVMALNIAEDLTLIRIDLPEKNLFPPLCPRIYITFDPITQKAAYFTIEVTAEKDVRNLGRVEEDGKHTPCGTAPVEGAELQHIIELARNDGTMTS